ncbi:Uncharacterized protein dnl_09860 [Desulfonema limicola]|uniref:Uncharacterized protein n=1 Tax=Desulfonema limicola TaxID=45656 RepID=A0A975B4R2_9BACT|nr:hypothetical protein [Desulfonema limicola]QTA78753.1 Uncharacterized protein dnl_09860 [Desulfonema limicola]
MPYDNKNIKAVKVRNYSIIGINQDYLLEKKCLANCDFVKNMADTLYERRNIYEVVYIVHDRHICGKFANKGEKDITEAEEYDFIWDIPFTVRKAVLFSHFDVTPPPIYQFLLKYLGQDKTENFNPDLFLDDLLQYIQRERLSPCSDTVECIRYFRHQWDNVWKAMEMNANRAKRAFSSSGHIRPTALKEFKLSHIEKLYQEYERIKPRIHLHTPEICRQLSVLSDNISETMINIQGEILSAEESINAAFACVEMMQKVSNILKKEELNHGK